MATGSGKFTCNNNGSDMDRSRNLQIDAVNQNQNKKNGLINGYNKYKKNGINGKNGLNGKNGKNNHVCC